MVSFAMRLVCESIHIATQMFDAGPVNVITLGPLWSASWWTSSPPLTNGSWVMNSDPAMSMLEASAGAEETAESLVTASVSVSVWSALVAATAVIREL